MELISSLINKILEFKPDNDMALKACRHLNKKAREDLFSSKIWPQRIAEGYWYEALIYEELLSISEKTNIINKIIKKRADVSRKQSKPKLGQNGFFYDSEGSIVVRGNGQDLAEFDNILVDRNSNYIFLEIVISKKNLQDFDREILFKRNLLMKLIKQKRIPFVIISAVDISNIASIKLLLKNPDNYYVTHNVKGTKQMLNFEEAIKYPRVKSNSTKLWDLNKIPTNNSFQYKKYHNKLRNQIFDSIKKNIPIDELIKRIKKDSIISKIILGGLYPSSIKYLSREKEFIINNKKFSTQELMKYFSKSVLAVNSPDLRPVLYLKVRKKFLRVKWNDTYIKFGPLTENTFRFERNVPSFVGFYLWLESISPNIGIKRTRGIIEYCLRDEIMGSRKKNQIPNIKIN